MTNLESEYNSTISPHSYLTIATPASRASYLVSLSVAKNPNHNDFSIISFSGVTNTIPTLASFQLEAPSV